MNQTNAKKLDKERESEKRMLRIREGGKTYEDGNGGKAENCRWSILTATYFGNKCKRKKLIFNIFV